jgi:hypothetical protein
MCVSQLVKDFRSSRCVAMSISEGDGAKTTLGSFQKPAVHGVLGTYVLGPSRWSMAVRFVRGVTWSGQYWQESESVIVRILHAGFIACRRLRWACRSLGSAYERGGMPIILCSGSTGVVQKTLVILQILSF